jgi:L-ribulose-5-phosphate 4-epimerase
MNIQEAGREVLSACKHLVEQGLTVGTAGNISARAASDDVFVITPTSMDYNLLTADDLVVLNFAGLVVEGKHKPSVEVDMHRLIFKARPDIVAIVHTHSLFATALASCKQINSIPPYDIEIISYLGGQIGVAEFAPPGTRELADNTVKALGKNAAALLRNHGAIGVGGSAKTAITACEIIERSSQALFFTQLFGGISPIPTEFVNIAREKSLLKRSVIN